MIVTLLTVFASFAGAMRLLSLVAETRRVAAAILDGYELTLDQARACAHADDEDAPIATSPASTSRLPSIEEVAEMSSAA